MIKYRSLLYMSMFTVGVFGLHACSPVAPSFDKRAFMKASQPQSPSTEEHQPKDPNVVDGPLVISESEKPTAGNPADGTKSEKPGIRPSILTATELKGFEDILDESMDLVALDEAAIRSFKSKKKATLNLDWKFTPRAVALIVDVNHSALKDLPLEQYEVRLESVRDGVWTLSESEGVEKTLSYLVRDKLESIRLASGRDSLSRAKKEIEYHRTVRASDLDLADRKAEEASDLPIR